MTAQIPDRVNYRGRIYALVGVRGGGLFDPEELGLDLGGNNTGCWRGYIATYCMLDGNLRMQSLEVSPRHRKDGTKPEMHPVYGGFYSPETERYHLMTEGVSFTGGMLLGRDFLQEFYVHMGHHPAWKYGEVWELIFERGVLREQHDRTAAMAKVREKMKDLPLRPAPGEPNWEEHRKWIEGTFSLDY